jgi:nuclear pore complex protein Nup155
VGQIVLLGVCCSGDSFGGNPYAEISLQPLPEYTIPTDGVTMTCITATEKGRIFLGGRDGHLYELLYTKGTGWQSRCRKVCHTGGLSNLLSRWVVPNALKFGAVDAVIEITIDEERNILYTRTQESKIQVFDLGKNGDGAPNKVAEEGCIGEQRDSRSRNGGSRVVSRATKTTLVSIAPLSTVQSKWLHLVAVASDGRRIYLSTSPSTGVSITAGNTPGGQCPSMLRVVMTRPAPSIGVNGGAHPFGNLGRLQSESGFIIKCEAAHYSSGALILSDASPPTASRMLVTTQDLTDPSPSGPGNLSVGRQGTRALFALREMLTMVGVGGRTLAIADVLPPPEQAAAVEFSVCEPGAISPYGTQQLSEETRARRLWARGELATQHMLPQRRAVVLSTMGLTEIVFNRPVDILQRLLELSAPRAVLEDFFQHYGAGEAAAMCLLLAARLTSDDENLVSTAVAERAADSFEDPRLVGVPQMQGGPASASVINANGGGFNMGQVVQEAEPVFSGAHEGLCLCTARLLQSVWELPVMDVKDSAVGDNKGEGGVMVCRFVSFLANL